MENIQDKLECEEAAKSLDLPDYSAPDYSRLQDHNKPHGCIYADNDYLELNDYQYPATECGSHDGSYTYDCICRGKCKY